MNDVPAVLYEAHAMESQLEFPVPFMRRSSQQHRLAFLGARDAGGLSGVLDWGHINRQRASWRGAVFGAWSWSFVPRLRSSVGRRLKC